MTYQIQYENGTKQVKQLIDQSTYNDWVKEQNRIQLNLLRYSGEQVNRLLQEHRKQLPDYYFTSESPLGIALTTDRLETAYCSVSVTFTQVTS